MSTIWRVLKRKKVIDPINVEETQLARRLNTFDLTALGVGSTLGVGVYVLAGQVAIIAGPSVVLSFFIAAVASVFAGLCYAEFGARAPRAGSAYIYSYVCVGEFIAFIIGWNLILEYIIGSASVAKGLSLYLDNLLNHTLQNTFQEFAPINLAYMSKYFDFFAFGISILLAIALAFGLKESSLANNIFTTLNIGVVIFVIIAGAIKADPSNWTYKPDASANATVVGTGGFFPFGIEGTIKGAATCFYGFVGFDCIATTGEEVKNPKRAIPISIILSLLIIFLSYFGISTVVTLMVPYYLQDFNAPIPYAFEHVGWEWAKWIVSIGGIFGLCASLFGAMFPLPRIIYAMANDSLVFKFLGRISTRFQTPVIGTLLAGFLTGLMAALFELTQLVKMMSIGTLMAYTIVAASVLLLRFSKDEGRSVYLPVRNHTDSEDSESYTDETTNLSINEDNEPLSFEPNDSSSTLGQIFNCGRNYEPTKKSQTIVAVEVFLYCITCVLIGLSAIFLKHPIANGEIWAITLASCFIFLAAMILMSMSTQPVSRKELNFKVPLVPLIPALSILANIYLMLMLDTHTWIRFAVWMAVGLPIYYFSVKPIDDQPSKHLSKFNEIHINEKSNGLVHSYTNNGFIDDSSTHIGISNEIKSPLFPPKIDEKTEELKIQQELEKFDEMLDEVVNDLDKNRKPSVGSVSVSDLVTREENVVADVHCDNVAKLALLSPNENNIKDENNSSEISTQIESNHSENIITEKPITNSAPKVNLDTQPLLNRPISFISVSGSDQEPVETYQYISPTVTPPPSINSSPLLSPNLDNEMPSPIPPPPPPPLPVTVNSDTNATTNLPENKKNTRETLPRVTSNKIKEVTLRPIRKKEEKTEVPFEPDDYNLKISSNKTKSFMEKLNNKLSRINLQPTYIVPLPTKKGKAPPPPKIEKNENVITESIDANKAKEKLGLYINSRISLIESTKNDTNNEDPLVNNNIVSDQLKSDKADDTEENDETEENTDAVFLEHKNRMKKVFRSLKSLDVTKEPQQQPSRNVKSLQLKQDETNHRQAMSEIFKTIELRRKESSNQQSKV